MGYVHQGIEKRIYGKLESDEMFTLKLRRVMELKSQGFPVSWYRNKFNILMIHRNAKWWSMAELAKVEKRYEWW